jgi:hypothetical protein
VLSFLFVVCSIYGPLVCFYIVYIYIYMSVLKNGYRHVLSFFCCCLFYLRPSCMCPMCCIAARGLCCPFYLEPSRCAAFFFVLSFFCCCLFYLRPSCMCPMCCIAARRLCRPFYLSMRTVRPLYLYENCPVYETPSLCRRSFLCARYRNCPLQSEVR